MLTPWLSQKSNRISAAHILMGILNGDSCACSDSRPIFVTTNLKTGVHWYGLFLPNSLCDPSLPAAAVANGYDKVWSQPSSQGEYTTTTLFFLFTR